MTTQFVRFALAGGFAAAINVGARLTLSQVMPFQAAVVVAYLIGMATAFILNRIFVFEPSGHRLHTEVIRFTLINLAALVQVWIVSVGLAEYVFPMAGMTWHADLVAHIIGVLSPMVVSFFGHKYFTFKSKAI